MAKRRHRRKRPLRLVTILVLGFVCVVVLALGLAGVLAVPLLTANQQDYNRAQADERLHCEFGTVESQIAGFWKQGVLPNTTNTKPSLKTNTSCDGRIVSNPQVPPKGNASVEQIQDFLKTGLVTNQRLLFFVTWKSNGTPNKPGTDPWVVFDTTDDPQSNLTGNELSVIPDLANVAPAQLRSKTGDFTQNGQHYHYIVGAVSVNGDCLRRDITTKSTIGPFSINPCMSLLPVELPATYRVLDISRATYFVLAEPVNDSGDFVANQIPALLGAGVIALVVAIIAAFLLARFIARPLARIATGTEAIAAGDYGHRVPEEGSYEVAHLAASFNHMVNEVSESQRVQRELIGNVSHELKTPLTAIRGFSQAMTDGILRKPEDFAGPAQIINNETERMIRLVNTLLDLSKLEGGQVELAHDPIDLADILAHVVTSLGVRAKAANISLDRQIGPVPPVSGDTDRMLQIFTNLTDNAIKYTGRGGRVTVVCGLYRATDSAPVAITPPSADGGSPQAAPLPPRPKNAKTGPRSPQFAAPLPDAPTFALGTVSVGSTVWVEVRDTGQGISARDLPHIFERFYQAEKSRSKQVGGVGLGLAITKELILAQNGAVSVQSQPAQGTIFRVEFPVTADAQQYLADPRTPFPYDRFYHPFSESLLLSDDTKEA